MFNFLLINNVSVFFRQGVYKMSADPGGKCLFSPFFRQGVYKMSADPGGKCLFSPFF